MKLLQGRDHHEAVIGAVREARTSVWIGTANVKQMLVRGAGRRYRSVLTVLAERARAGVELRLLHASRPSRPFIESFDDEPDLISAMELRMCPRVHFKVVIVDGAQLYLGSANWTGAGLGAKGDDRRNFELGILTDDEQMLDETQALYERVWRGGACATCKLRDQCEAPLDLG